MKSVKFCKKCGLILVAKKEKGDVFLVCRKCDYRTKEYKPIEIEENIHKKPLDDIVVMEQGKEALPKTKTECPKCGHMEAVWWIQQTRSTDEAPTLFLRCVKCKHSWREYG